MAEDIQFGVKRRAHHGLGDAPDLCTLEAERAPSYGNPNLTLTLYT